jgi:uncharacterized protein YkwD
MSRLLQYCCAVLVVVLALLQSAEALSGATRKSILAVHNKFRTKHHAPKLVYSETLEKYAQKVSNTCKMEHSGGPYGENLAMGYKNAGSAITAWYNEVKNYNYNSPGFSGSTGHFTQVVWKSTKEVGCGITTCNGGTKFVTCSYKDPGNMVGNNNLYFKQNVLKP